MVRKMKWLAGLIIALSVVGTASAQPTSPPTADQMIEAAKKGDIAFVRAGLSAGFPVDTKTPWTLLGEACETTNYDLARMLVDEFHADVNEWYGYGRGASP